MRLLIAFIGLSLLWSLTPLAIKWSGEGPGFLLGAALRMAVGYAGVLAVVLLARLRVPLDGRALLSYVAGSVQIFGSMSLTYWSAQHLPSGWISVVFGLTPLITAPLAALVLREPSLTPLRLLSYGLGSLGLALMFHTALKLSATAVLGILGILLAACLQALSAVWVKALDRPLNPFVQLAGTLTLAVPLYFGVWWLVEGDWPPSLPQRALYSIGFLGLIATTFGFALYFYILKHLAAGRVALITLITPVLSLYVGDLLNQEPITPGVLLGTLMIVSALILYEWSALSSLLFGARATPRPQRGSATARRSRRRFRASFRR